MPNPTASPLGVCLTLAQAIGRTRTVDEIYTIALDALRDALGVTRASVLLFDPDGVMRFKAWRGLSPTYRQAVEGHTPWQPDSPDPQPLAVSDVHEDPSLAPYLPIVRAEGIAAMAFIPLVSGGRVIGKFMLYHEQPHAFSATELEMAALVASQVAFAVERTRAEAQARRSEERLRFALDAAQMGTWDWDLVANTVRWSDNLERIHGLPAGTFDGTFASYEREVHPDDRAAVLRSIERALSDGVPHEVEYRLVAPDGTIRWAEGKGRVEREDGRPVRMTGVCMIVTRRKEAELARLSAAEEASRLKDEFLATLSHELRTPLNAILGWAQIASGTQSLPERTRHALEVIRRNAAVQAQLIEDILDVSRIITGKLDIQRETLTLAPLVETVVNGLGPVASAKRIDLQLAIEPHLPGVDGDLKRLHQVLSNVISNAIKFTPEGGRVEVRCAAAGAWVEIVVCDSGIGIAPEFLPFVFDRFRQADSRATRAHGGLGLGLAIAQHLIGLHGGEIRAESDGLHCGTSITLRLPASVGTAAGTPHAEDDDASAVPQMTGLRVLVVEDQADSRELLAVLFERCGAQVISCEDAEAALARLEEAPADLIVADIAMPRIDGYELIRRVRSGHRTVPAIAVSAYARPEDRQAALGAGYDAHVPKPIEGSQLLRAVRTILQGQNL